MVGAFDEFEVVLDNEEGVPLLHQAVEHAEQHLEVAEVKAGAGFIQNEQAALALLLSRERIHQDMSELQALVLAAREGVERLAEPQVAQPHIHQHLQARGNAPGAGVLLAGKEALGVGDVQREHFGHVVAQQGDGERLLGVARAVAQGAGHEDIGEELHLHLLLPQTGAARAAAIAAVEGEIAGLQAACLGSGLGHEERADILEHADVHRGGAARRAHNGALIHQHHFLHGIQPGDAAHLYLVLVVQLIGVYRAEQHLAGQRALAAAGDAREAVVHAQRNLHREIVQVVALRPLDADAPLPPAAARRHGDAAAAAEELPRERICLLRNARGLAGIHQLAARSTAARAHIHEVVGGAHHGFLVLHHHQRVAAVGQAAHSGDEAGGVARMEADGGFIEYKEGLGKCGAQTGGEAHALNLAAGKRAGEAAGGDIAQPHLAEVGHAAAELLHGLLQRAVGAGVAQHIRIQPGQQLIHGQRLHLRHSEPADGEGQRLGAQAAAVALGAHAVHAVEGEEDAHAHLVRMLLHVVENPLVAIPQAAVPGLPGVHVAAFAVEHPVLLLLAELVPRHIHAHGAAGLVGLHEILVAGGKRGGGKHLQGAVGNRFVGDDAAVVVVGDAAAVALAGGACAQRRIAAEEAGARLLQRVPVAAELAGLLPAAICRGEGDLRHILPQVQGGFQRLHEAGAGIGHQLHAVLHHQPALHAQGRFLRLGKTQHTAPHQYAQVALRLERLHHFRKRAHGAHRKAHQRRCTGMRGYQLIGHALRRGGAHHIASGIAPHGQAGENELQVLIHAGHGAHGGAGVLHAVALAQGNGGRHILHRLHIRAVHAVHELSHIGREGLHIAPLPLGIQGTHGQRGLAAAARARHHRDAPQRNIHIHPL